MRDCMDLHTHTLMSGHAYNTINEMIAMAKKKDLDLLAITEHGPAMQGTATDFYFDNIKILPRDYDGMKVLFGIEANILDSNGRVDAWQRLLEQLDVVIASLHTPCFGNYSKELNTKACIEAMKNPFVNILGHPDDGRLPVDAKAIVEAAKEYKVLIEVNSSSLSPMSHRLNAKENYGEILKYCKELGVPVIVNSDAHADVYIKNHADAFALLAEYNFPEELVVNRSVDAVKEYLNYYRRQNK